MSLRWFEMVKTKSYRDGLMDSGLSDFDEEVIDDRARHLYVIELSSA